eukprot:7551365-Alexandrium_andersonii.AAC.1
MWRAAASGPEQGSARSLSSGPRWWGTPLAWRSTTSGSSVVRIGARFEMCPEGARVVVPEKKPREIPRGVADFVRRGFAMKRRV